MRFGSVCSGIEAASVAWEPLGWKAAWLSEIEPFPSAVLAHHYPDVPNLGDMTTLPERIANGEVEAPDLFCGGTPCQAFSVAGSRKSLDDARGNLSLTFCEIANAIDTRRAGYAQQPAIIFWENVPGVLSTKDNAFGCFLAGLAGEDEPLVAPGEKWSNAGAVYGPQRAVAWRVLDAQYFGVAQRRRRVFVVASARDGFDPAAVLFEFDGLRRDSAPSRQTWQEVTPTIRAGATNGGPGHDARSGDSKDELIVPVLSQCITTGTGQRYDPEAETILPVATFSCAGIGAYTEDTNAATLLKSGQDLGNGCEALAVVGAICKDSFSGGMGGRPDGAAVGHVVVHGTQDPCVSDIAFAQGRNNGGENVVIGWDNDLNASHEQIGTLLKGGDGGRHEGVMTPAMQVRRLTPVECERLQGFPDNYTAIPWRKKQADECPDGPRYKALGNSWAVPNVRWIGRRIQLALEVAA